MNTQKLHFEHIRTEVIRPTLEYLGMWSNAAESLVLGTGIYESNFSYLKQVGGGPALGYYQIEPATHADLYENFLAYHTEIKTKLVRLLGMTPTPTEQLVSNLRYTTAVCRLIYYRHPEPLPEDIGGMAMLYKKWYNTPGGKGTAAGWALRAREHNV